MTPPPALHPEGTGIQSMLEEAVSLHQSGRRDEASQLYRRIIALHPEHFDATHLLGVAELQQGRYSQAQQLISAALVLQPKSVPALNNLATALLETGDVQGALSAAEKARRLQPDAFEVLVTMGAILHRLGNFREAIEPLLAANKLVPYSPHVCNLLGACYLKTEQPRAALEVFETATSAGVSEVDLWVNQSVTLNALGQHEPALESAKKALSLSPESIGALTAMANAQFEMGRLDDAIETYKTAVAIAPHSLTLCAFANALITGGLHSEAAQYIRQALELGPDHTPAHWLFAVSQVAPMPATPEELQRSRLAFANGLTDLANWYGRTKPPEPYRTVGVIQPFFLAYQPFNNRLLMEQYGNICVEWMKTFPDSTVARPSVNKPRGSRIRVGIASTHIRNHSVWIAIAKGWVEHLNKKRFDIHLFHLGLQSDAESIRARSLSAHFEDQPVELAGWTEVIRRAELDVLIYPAVGMDAITTQLAAMRLAPVQVNTWGHPETSGFTTLDYYLSAECLEPNDAQNNYTEKLVKLPNLGVVIDPLKPKAADPGLERLGLPTDEPLLLCPGSPFKYTSNYDSVWIDIARGLKRGRLVFFAGKSGAMYAMLEQRLRASFAAAGVDFDSRVKIVGHMDRPRFFGLMQRSALMLDTLGFSGFNTAAQAIECGLPILTFEGEFMRGRLASCFMRRMEIPDLIATTKDAFVASAIELAGDDKWRSRLTRQIEKKRSLVFGDKAVVRGLEKFLVEVVENS